MLHHRQRFNGFPRITKRGATGQIRLDAGLPLTIVANDIGCAFAETHVGERDEGIYPLRVVTDAYLLEDLSIGARIFLKQDPNGDSSIAGIELGERGADIPDGRYPDRFRQTFG